MGKIVAIANQKGGVGKTTTAINLSCAVGEQDKKVLLIDLDPQGNASSGYGFRKKAIEKSIYDIIIGNCDIKDAILKTNCENVDIIPSGMNLAGAEIELVSVEKREFLLKNAINTIRHLYDFIFIDCPPSLGLLNVNALSAATSILVPIQCEYLALEGLSQLMNTVRKIKESYNPGLYIEGVLLTMFDGRLNLTLQVMDEVKKYFADKVYKHTIARNVRLSEAPSHGVPCLIYDRYSKGSLAYRELAREFLKKNKGI